MILSDPEVRLHPEVEKSYNYDRGGGRTYGKGRRGRRWQGMRKGAQDGV